MSQAEPSRSADEAEVPDVPEDVTAAQEACFTVGHCSYQTIPSTIHYQEPKKD